MLMFISDFAVVLIFTDDDDGGTMLVKDLKKRDYWILLKEIYNIVRYKLHLKAEPRDLPAI